MPSFADQLTNQQIGRGELRAYQLGQPSCRTPPQEEVCAAACGDAQAAQTRCRRSRHLHYLSGRSQRRVLFRDTGKRRAVPRQVREQRDEPQRDAGRSPACRWSAIATDVARSGSASRRCSRSRGGRRRGSCRARTRTDGAGAEHHAGRGAAAASASGRVRACRPRRSPCHVTALEDAAPAVAPAVEQALEELAKHSSAVPTPFASRDHGAVVARVVRDLDRVQRCADARFGRQVGAGVEAEAGHVIAGDARQRAAACAEAERLESHRFADGDRKNERNDSPATFSTRSAITKPAVSAWYAWCCPAGPAQVRVISSQDALESSSSSGTSRPRVGTVRMPALWHSSW